MRVIPLLITGLLLLAACGTESASSEPADGAPATTAAPAPPEPAATGETGAWPADDVDAFVDACTAQADAELCGCAADVLQSEVDYDELLASAGETMSAAALPPDLLALVVETCL